MIYVFAALLITLLGVAYVKGFDFTSRHAPDRLPQFCMLMAAIRFLLLATYFAISVYICESREEAFRFAIIYIIMYVVMMVATLSMRH